MAVVGVITLLMLAMVMGGGMRVFERFMPESALVWLDENDGFGGLFSMSGTVSLAGGITGPTGDAAKDPYAHLRDGSSGIRGSNKVVPMAQGQVAFVADVVTGRRISSGSYAPGTVKVLTPLEGCAFTAPTAGAFVGHVQSTGRSAISVSLATYGDEELAEAVKTFAKVYRKSGRKQVYGLKDHSFEAFDVVVTETQKPTYLVLSASGGRPKLWNIQLAPGATLERIVLIGGDQAGVVNVDPSVPVEVMLYAALTSCRVPAPSYPLNPGHMLYQSLEAGHVSQEEADESLTRLARQNAAWDTWFRSSFGVSANETMAGNWDGGTIAAVGPLPPTPEGKAAYTKVSGGLARITVDTYVEYPALKKDGADFASRVVAIATAFAGGDLETLKLKENF